MGRATSLSLTGTQGSTQGQVWNFLEAGGPGAAIGPPRSALGSTGGPSFASAGYFGSQEEFCGGPTPLDSADFVYVQHGGQGGHLADSYDGPFHAGGARGPKVFKLQLGAWVDTVSRDRLKAHLGVVDPEVASPRPRGQPPGAEVGFTLQTGPSE